jgi:hypothetical protein
MIVPQAYKDFVSKWEGGLANQKYDKGGLTNRGFIQSTYKTMLEYGLKNRLINPKYANNPFNKIDDKLHSQLIDTFYHYYSLNYLNSIPLGLIINEYLFGSEISYYRVYKILQKYIINATAKPTAEAFKEVNKLPSDTQKQIAIELVKDRYQLFKDIVKQDQNQSKFYSGWVNRLNNFIITDFTSKSVLGTILKVATLIYFTKTFISRI